MYGNELIIDASGCDPSLFTRDNIAKYLASVCVAIGATKCELYFWDDDGLPEDERQTKPKTKGRTAVQFLLESNITIHTLDILREVYINVFYCGPFEKEIVDRLTEQFFSGTVVSRMITRGR